MRSLDKSVEHPIALPEWPLKAVRKQANGDIWLAGGPVRDLLMGRPPSDWDFVVGQHAIKLARAVADALGGAFYALDAERGTGRAIVTDPETGQPISLDFAEMRGATLTQDLRHRDFTINAMAATLDGELKDPTGGRQDLVRGVIRLTHAGSLQEDPARLIRAVRIATQLGFSLTPQTQKQIHADVAAIATVAAERVRDELIKLLTSENVSRGLELLDDLSLLAYVLPEAVANCPKTQPPRPAAHLARTGAVLEITSALVNPPDAGSLAAPLTAIAHKFRAELAGYFSMPLDAGLTRRELAPWCSLFLTGVAGDEACQRAAERADKRLSALHFSARARAFVVTTVRNTWRFRELSQHLHSACPYNHRRELYHYFRQVEETGVLIALLSLAEKQAGSSALPTFQTGKTALTALHAVLTTYFYLSDEIVDPQPLLTGVDLLRMGIPQGPKLGAALEALREAQAAGDISTAVEAQDWIRKLTSKW